MATGLLYKSVKQAIVDNAKRVTYARELVYKRMSELKNNGGTAESKGRRDLLSKMFEISATKGDKVDFHLPEIEMESWVNIQAGVDTTAIALQAILYHILKDARVHQKLLSELDAALRNQRIAIPIKYSDALKLPYLSACIKEAMRLHPSVGLQLPRHPPPEGCHISGYYFPHSARVGVNAAVLHYNQDVFGEDASSFRPERWSESNAAEMDRHLLTFGAGTRTCTGKHISLAEIFKLIPHILLKFDMELVDAETPLTKQDWWFHKIKDFRVSVHERKVCD